MILMLCLCITSMMQNTVSTFQRRRATSSKSWSGTRRPHRPPPAPAAAPRSPRPHAPAPRRARTRRRGEGASGRPWPPKRRPSATCRTTGPPPRSPPTISARRARTGASTRTGASGACSTAVRFELFPAFSRLRLFFVSFDFWFEPCIYITDIIFLNSFFNWEIGQYLLLLRG
jgi:hypothetical protein